MSINYEATATALAGLDQNNWLTTVSGVEWDTNSQINGSLPTGDWAAVAAWCDSQSHTYETTEDSGTTTYTITVS